MKATDRRRATLATLLTVIAIPALLFVNRGNGSGSTVASSPGEESAPATSAYQPELPVFIDSRPVVPPPAIVDVVVPALPTSQQAEGQANYRRFGDLAKNPCSTLLAPTGALLTVLNIDNGKTVTCTNVGDILIPPGTDLVIHTELFSTLSDLTDAPITVRISW